MDPDLKQFLNHVSRQHGYDLAKLLKTDEIVLLHLLHTHHQDSVAHSINVAKDVVFVASNLGLNEREVERLEIAALLHDIGKIYMHTIVLDQGVDINEQMAIIKEYGIIVDPKDNLLSKIKMYQLVEHRTHLPGWNKKHISQIEARNILHALRDQAQISILEHIRNHQLYTRELLKQAKVPPRIIDIASTHHPEYFKDIANTDEISILSAVDKFNAMIQSEGIRNYDSRKGRSEALIFLIDKLHEKKEVVKELAKKHLPLEINELEEAVTHMIRLFKSNTDISKKVVERIEVKLVAWLMAVKKLKINIFSKRKVLQEYIYLQTQLRLAEAEGRVH
ncbi:MAG: HD domain-containing protein [Nanoarchaeota archaeon]